jgi:mycothiol S-conjugate amidase
MQVHAHPDDESSKGSATTAYYVAQGVEVMVVTCTGGEAGDILNKALDTPENWANLPQLRQHEMAEAARILGIHQRWLGYHDSGFPADENYMPPADSFAAQDPEVAAGRLVKIIREFRPHVLTAYTPDGGYPHPDHIQAHRVAVAAFRQAADKELWPEHGEAWQIPKLYYDRTLNEFKWAAFDEALIADGQEPRFAGRRTYAHEEPEYTITTKIPCAEYFGVRRQALLAHATQVSPDDKFWFSLPLEEEMKVWPWEDWHLEVSHVPTSIPEDDMFAGLREA